MGFGTAGVRGVFNATQKVGEVFDISECSAFVFGRGRYGVGWDGRKSSVVLSRAVASAVMATGSTCLSFGLVPTPVTAFGTRAEGCALGFSVTASHNPPEFSGVKFFNPQGMELSREEERRIEVGMVVESKKSSMEVGDVEKREGVLDSYLDSMRTKFIPASKGLKIIVDCANGPGSLVTPRLLAEMGHSVVSLNGQISWRFPARAPEPTVGNLNDTMSIVSRLGADIGFAHDGDADRLVMVNREGRIVPDSAVAIIALRSLGTQTGSVILSENTSTAVEEEAERLGRRVVRARVGKTFSTIGQEQAVFASEPSKVVDPKWGLWEDGMYSALLIADAVSRDASLFELLDSEPIWKYRQVDVSFSVDFTMLVAKAGSVLEQFRIQEVRRLDGLKVIFRDGSWIMFRASGTEPKTRIYCESRDTTRLEELVGYGKKLVDDCAALAR